MTQEASTETESANFQESFTEQHFRKLIARIHKTSAKVRRIDLAELMELAWVDGMLEPFAERLIRSRPDLKEEIEQACRDLQIAD